MGKSSADGAVDLRHAAQAIGVLDAGIDRVGAMRLANLASFKDSGQIGGRGDLASVRARLVNAPVEGYRGAHQRFERHSSSQVGDLCQAGRVDYGERPYTGHGLSAVEQRQTFFGGQLEWSETGDGQGLGSRLAYPVADRFAFADDHQCEMCKRSQVAAGSH